MTNITLGFTNDFFIPAVFIVILGACGFIPDMPLIFNVIGAMIILIGIIMLLVKSGISVDEDKKRLRKYFSLAWIRFGKWHNVDKHSTIELETTQESTSLAGPVNSVDINTRTYDLILIKDSRRTEIYEFLDYKLAKRVFQTVKDNLKIEGTDILAQRLKNSNPASRRR